MTHVHALGRLLGRPQAAVLVDHGVSALRDLLRSPDDGWVPGVDPATGRPTSPEHRAYDHAFVVLAASSATVAGADGAAELLAEALGVLQTRFLDPAEGLLVDVCAPQWTSVEPYRGANANMHGVEAMLAAADVTGEPGWRDRALVVTERLVHGWGREAGWRIPEHFTATWVPDPDHNSEERSHPFRPYGSTVGHWFEWARLCVALAAALDGDAPPWLIEDARALVDAAAREGWVDEPSPGFLYTVDAAGRPVARNRLHWVLSEAVLAADALHRATGDARYESWYRSWWRHAGDTFVDRDGGSWWHELDEHNRPSTSVWSGKPDAYHAVQACLFPMLPVAPTAATALAARRAASA